MALWHVEAERAALAALPFHWHLSKYDPAKSISGHYDDGTWTSISDIGASFNGVEPTREAYLVAE